ncbi:succinate dehydrogenase assembly factor 4 [Nitrospirillum amazonense]|nr:succinate dehydrogenase assembly factor 4 [Nitrospirillum amazonense]
MSKPPPHMPDPKAPVFKTHVAPTTPATPETQPEPAKGPAAEQPAVREIGGPSGPEPTRYGDWERKGRCSDF